MQQVQHPHHKVEGVIAKESRIQLQWVQQCAIQDPEGQMGSWVMMNTTAKTTPEVHIPF